MNHFGIVANVGKGLFARSAQPDGIDYKSLISLGFDTLYKVNTDKEYSNKVELDFFGGETRQVILEPYPPLFEIPSKEVVLKTVFTINKMMLEGRRVLLHCTHGTDRTGFLVAAYRIKYLNWNFNEVQEERDFYGINPARDFFLDNKMVQFLKTLTE